MKKEPFLQVSKRRNKARWQERLLIRFIAFHCTDRVRSGDRCPGKDESGGCL